jgi:hypothetical protein
MYEGYMSFDGVEVINMERLMAYVDAGIVPSGVAVEDCTGTCEGLGEALGDQPYTSPIQDQPPWFDQHNPDTVDFAGIVPLEVTGMDGSVRTVEMVNLLTRGAVPMRPVYGPRTIAVSAFLVGRTSAGVEAGLAWLTNVLHRVCTDTGACDGADLKAFTSCPTPICPGGIGSPDDPLEPTTWPYSPDTWLVAGGHTQAAGVGYTESQADPGVDPSNSPGDSVLISDAPLLFQNWSPNPSAEVNVTGWHKDPTSGNAAWGTATVVQGTLPADPAHVGMHSARITFTAVAGQPSAQTQALTGLPNGWYSAEMWLYAQAAGAVEPYVAVGGANVIAEPVTVAGQWVRRVVSFQVTGATTAAEVGVRSVANNSAAVVYVDGIVVTRLNGQAIQRSDFEQGTSPWAPTTLGGFVAAGEVTSSTVQHVTGLASMKITWGALALGRWDDTDAAVTWDTVDPPTLQWDQWPTDTP